MNESIEKRVFDEGPRKTQRISTLRIDIAHCFEAFAEPREGFGVFELLKINESPINKPVFAFDIVHLAICKNRPISEN